MVVRLTDTDRLDGLRAVGEAVARTILAVRDALEPGITTAELDDVGRLVLESHEAQSAPEVDVGFPAATCISINDQAAHGIPGALVVREGDLVNIDVSAVRDGYYADAGASFPVGKVSGAAQDLVDSTRQALHAAIGAVRAGRPLNVVGRAVQTVARERGYSIVRNLCGHGVGESLHEEPRAVLNYYDPYDRRRLRVGQVMTIEPFFSPTADKAVEATDGWTLCTADGSLAAQFEHTIVVTRGEAVILTAIDSVPAW